MIRRARDVGTRESLATLPRISPFKLNVLCLDETDNIE